jgi:hypothetical protein
MACLDQIRAFGDDVWRLDDDHLAALNLRMAEPLDIEERNIDFGRRFFYPRYTLEQARQKTTDFLAEHGEIDTRSVWPKRCRRGSYVGWFEETPGPYDADERHPLCFPQGCADERLGWCLAAMGSQYASLWANSPNRGVWEGSEWCHLECVATPALSLMRRFYPTCEVLTRL